MTACCTGEISGQHRSARELKSQSRLVHRGEAFAKRPIGTASRLVNELIGYFSDAQKGQEGK